MSGDGPYRALPPKTYFRNSATPKLHSEMGMPNIVPVDSLRMMMPESALWPQGAMWGLHDFSLHGAQGGASFRELIEKSYGGARQRGGVGDAGAVRQLRRLPRHVRGAERRTAWACCSG